MDSNSDTKRRIIKAATSLFVDKGYDSVSVKDICSLAEVNIASVNYHFGGKPELYRKIVDELVVNHPKPPAPLGDEDPSVYTFDFVLGLISSVSNWEDPLMRLVANEHMKPTGIFADSLLNDMKDRHEAIVGFYINKFGISRETAEIAIFSMVGSVMHFSRGRCFVSKLSPWLYEGETLSKSGKRVLAEEISKNAVAALSSRARQIS